MLNHSILLVDDETNILKSLKRLFQDTNYKIYIAETADDGLVALEENDIDLVISDYKMPKKNGVEFLKDVKEKYPNTIRMILSGFADVSAIVDSINEGNVYKFLAKPWNDQELLTTVKRALEHFKLQELNDNLLEKLQCTNNELLKLTESLEKTVIERTKDLEVKNSALKTSQYILNLLPVGVFGVDSDGMVVYINKIAVNYLSLYNINLSSSILYNESPIAKCIVSHFDSKTKSQKTYHMPDKINAIIKPLKDAVGYIILIYKNNIDISLDSYKQTAEVENV